MSPMAVYAAHRQRNMVAFSLWLQSWEKPAFGSSHLDHLLEGYRTPEVVSVSRPQGGTDFRDRGKRYCDDNSKVYVIAWLSSASLETITRTRHLMETKAVLRER